MNLPDSIVFVLNGDSRIRTRLCALIGSAHMDVLPFGSAAEYLDFPKPEAPACVILDIDLPDMCGLELQRRIAATDPPIVFVSGNSDVSRSVRALKSGALDFITIPFEAATLLEAIRVAITHDRNTRAQRAAEATLHQRYATLTARERQVLLLVVSGRRNKQSAWELGISEFTLRIHRAQVMLKMQAASIAELVWMAGTLRVPVFRALRDPGVWQSSQPAFDR
jgi:FixJ family two-component response regulator